MISVAHSDRAGPGSLRALRSSDLPFVAVLCRNAGELSHRFKVSLLAIYSHEICHQLETREVDTILASGNGGQKIFIVPSYGLVAVFTGGNYNSERDTPPNEIMSSIVLPAILKRASHP